MVLQWVICPAISWLAAVSSWSICGLPGIWMRLQEVTAPAQKILCKFTKLALSCFSSPSINISWSVVMSQTLVPPFLSVSESLSLTTRGPTRDLIVTSAPHSFHQVLFSLCVWTTITVCWGHWIASNSYPWHFPLRSDISTPTPCIPVRLVYRTQKLVASFPKAAWSPDPLLIFSKQSKATVLCSYSADLHCFWLFDRLR